ncbi:PadR family transcriptional regulator [Methanocella sp. CWC-04]|uniref:PadR family transcriptional regulator n=1 Tax=Methanooceanicella nereidis TaxID=2052831 RepID=A0AAP2RDM8_9EURY|nr:PadR family transcriptional regulator [Methanocella sp. CWC-04]MCD1294680.1 PadR family transcriptional regulator [Methanocella sp. CWC-04]
MREDIDKWLKELKKGSTKLSLLALLRTGDRYGYELISELEKRTSGVIVLKESNAYPALHSMESDGLVNSYWKETEEGLPPRKYYKITPKGEELLQEMIKEWKKYVLAMNKVWGLEDGNK